MEKLNELVELAKEYNSATTAEEALAINNQFKATANRETIIAIAEAFRALEQRAEAAEVYSKSLNDIIDLREKDLRAAEADLTAPPVKLPKIIQIGYTDDEITAMCNVRNDAVAAIRAAGYQVEE